MFYYFAYGSCTCLDSLSGTLGLDVRDYLIGPAILEDYKLRFNYPSLNGINYYCNIDNQPGSQVEGCLFHLPQSVIEPLRDREGFSQGRYHEKMITVQSTDATHENVLVYQASVTSEEEGFPGERYLGLFERGLCDAQASDEYKSEVIERLQGLQQRVGQAQEVM